MPEITKLKGHLLAAANEGQPNYLVAAHCGISPSELAAYSSGRKHITAKHLDVLARYFGVDPNDLIGTYDLSTTPASSSD